MQYLSTPVSDSVYMEEKAVMITCMCSDVIFKDSHASCIVSIAKT